MLRWRDRRVNLPPYTRVHLAFSYFRAFADRILCSTELTFA